jgi:hypothetical protein
LRVVDRFANSPHAIMAGRAGFGNARVVEPRDRPFPGRMAALAFGLCNDVVAGFARCGDVVVTARASFGSACEYAALMAGVTCNLRVRSRQRKAGREMVKFFLGVDGRRKADGEYCHHQNCEKR